SGSGTALIHVNPIPQPNFNPSAIGGCSPLAITFVNQPETTFVSQRCVWNFGDGSPEVDNCSDVAHTFIDQQVYPVTLTVTSEQNCTNSITKNITVYPDPVAAFSFEPQPITMSNSLVRFFNLSSGATTFNWNIDSVGTFNQFNPLVQFPAEDEGIYNVCLRATSAFGCIDSICQPLKVNGEVLVNIPNTFTPNEDGYNEVWKPVVLGERPDMYELIIFNRWGQEIFRTTNPDQGWDGKGIMNELCPVGTYAYVVKFKSKYSGETIRKIGHVNLVN
ncbi:MAG TPA: gliding motility-associated C-terminal domain-containing protein, partial [Luteibaculaceae bacterium]|nr:gliding motility-associated C-terminal domain-containing protein [Luteibaculaceae bacterium]